MLFNSYEFIFMFLPIALIGTFWIAKSLGDYAALSWLLATSLIFYSWWEPAFLAVLFLSMTVNYLAAFLLGDRYPAKFRGSVLFVGITFNIGLLWQYKYASQLLSNLTWSGGILPGQEMGLPLAISFFTFQQIAYLVDTYRGGSPQKEPVTYALFITFFPQLISGPIVKASELIPQLSKRNIFVFNHTNFYAGLLIFAIGLTKKTVFADPLSTLASNGWDHAGELGFAEAWIVSLSYTLQIYFDFSAYSDMAIGIGLMLNIMLPVNFQSPYRASSVIDAWQRWHMTLTRWINHYLYRPLLRARKKFSFVYAMIITVFCMVIFGLWHGATWSYILFGIVNGVALVANHLWRKSKLPMPGMLGRIMTFSFINLVMTLNTSRNFSEVMSLHKNLFGINQGQAPFLIRTEILDINETSWSLISSTPPSATSSTSIFLLACLILLSLSVVFFPYNSNSITERFRLTPGFALGTVILLFIGIMCLGDHKPFHYFQF